MLKKTTDEINTVLWLFYQRGPDKTLSLISKEKKGIIPVSSCTAVFLFFFLKVFLLNGPLPVNFERGLLGFQL